jgi:heme exporter protein A
MQLAVEDLSVSRGERRVLDRLSFRLAPGEGLLLTGPNGAGKTTLIRTIAGFLRPDTGSVRLEGAEEPEDVGPYIHMIGHQNGIKPSLTVTENLTFWSRYLGSGDGAEVQIAVHRMHLDDIDDLPAGYLSAGQKRRLGLARLLVAKRPLWLLDEPTVSLDAASTEVLASVVAEHIAGGGMAIAATHIPLGIAVTRELKLGAATAGGVN